MTISANKIIGALIYRTRKSLNENAVFLKNLSSYYFAPNCIIDGKFNLWHYPGTPNEISNSLLSIGKATNGKLLKFPSFFNFQTIKQTKYKQTVTINYNLAIVGSVLNDWRTQTREDQVFDKLLRPIYDEFIKQIVSCGWFNIDLPIPSHTYYEVFTTGNNQGVLLDRYGGYVDAIELHNLSLNLKWNLCGDIIQKIEEENKLVTENFQQILKK